MRTVNRGRWSWPRTSITIGRLPECQVTINDKGASRRHAQIRHANGTYVLTDLGSTNGTRLNGQTIQTRELADGDRITIGTTTLEFREGSGVTPFALSALKYGLFALLFLFVWRSMRWAVRGLTVEPSPTGRKARKSGGAVPVPTGPSAVVVHPPEGKARTVKIGPSMTIGRAPECELLIDDTYASSQHARIFGKNGTWYVEDLGSTNGTFVNDQKLAAPAMVQPGDKIRVGTTVLELRR